MTKLIYGKLDYSEKKITKRFKKENKNNDHAFVITSATTMYVHGESKLENRGLPTKSFLNRKKTHLRQTLKKDDGKCLSRGAFDLPVYHHIIIVRVTSLITLHDVKYDVNSVAHEAESPETPKRAVRTGLGISGRRTVSFGKVVVEL